MHATDVRVPTRTATSLVPPLAQVCAAAQFGAAHEIATTWSVRNAAC